jgi:hypothetical protein
MPATFEQPNVHVAMPCDLFTQYERSGAMLRHHPPKYKQQREPYYRIKGEVRELRPQSKNSPLVAFKS